MSTEQGDLDDKSNANISEPVARDRFAVVAAATDAGGDHDSRAGVPGRARAAALSIDPECAGEPRDPAGPMSDIAALTAASRRSIEQFELAKASGSPSEVAAARVELQIIKSRLERARAEVVVHAEMSKALRAPRRIGR